MQVICNMLHITP